MASGLILPGIAMNILNNEGPRDYVYLCEVRILRHLFRFGLLEAEFDTERKYWSDPERYKKAPLFDKFIRVEFS